jgi:putative ABC transport system permease protein
VSAGARLLWLAGLRHHARHPLQTLLTILGIAAGMALLVAMQSAERSAERAFDQALATIAGAATHTVTAGPGGIPVERYVAAVRELGTGLLAPSVTAVARVEERADRTVLRVLGVDPLADVALRPWAAASRTAPSSAESSPTESLPAEPLPVGRLMTEPGTFVATSATLARLGVRRDGTLPLRIGGRSVAARCVGTLAVASATAAGLADTLLVDIATAQEWRQRLDRIDRLDVKLDGERAAAVLPRLRALFGPLCEVREVGASVGRLGELARGFRINLTALSLLSLLVGAFLVHETMRLAVTARRPSFGILRALGVPGGRIGRAIACESVVFGLCGGGLGALLGVFAAELLLQPLVRTLNDHYATFSLHAVDLEPALLLGCVGIGVVVAVVAGLGPAVAAARTSARSVLVPARASTLAAPWWRLPVLIALPAAAIAGVLLSTVGDRLVQAYSGMLAVIVAALALVPAALRLLLAVAARAASPLGPYARYTVRSTAAAHPHLALPVAAMVLSLATTIGMATLVQSFRGSVAEWLAQVLPGDVFVAVPGGVDERTQPFDAAIAAAIRSAPGIAAATAYRRTVGMVQAPGREDAREIDLVGVEPSAKFEASFPLLGGDPVARAALRRGDGAFVSEPLAFRRGLAVGDRLDVAGAHGPIELPVAAIYRDYGNERGEILVGGDWLQRHLPTPITAFGLEVAAGDDPHVLAEAVRQRAAAAGEQLVEVRVQRELRESSLQIFDRTFAITGVMRILCLLVACIGIYAAFAALQLERGAEIGLLRCVGASPARIGMVVLGQTALLGLCAGLLAWPIGVVLGHLLAQVINRVSFGWSLVSVATPAGAVVEACWLAVAAALIAGVQPAWRFARMRPAAGLREA